MLPLFVNLYEIRIITFQNYKRFQNISPPPPQAKPTVLSFPEAASSPSEVGFYISTSSAQPQL